WMIYQHWRNEKRLFETPAVNYARGSAKLLVTPFETFFKNSLGEFNNDWGQRVPYFTVVGNKLYATTSNKGSGIKGKQLLPKSILEQYGRVIELTGKHEVSAQIDWQPEMTFDFIVSSEEMKILQDSNLIASKNFEKPINLGDLYPQMLLVGNGIYGASNVKIAKTYESFEP
ncbi:MAG: hypothetical protein MRY83_13670, partial [Flavobacteriales bacterium]|nr:hypothetical protein [Flavobacteriales bacterium]